MTTTDREHARSLLRQSLGIPDAEFREGQWEAIDVVANQLKPRIRPRRVRVVSAFVFSHA